MTLASELAERIVAMTYDGLPGDAIKWAKIALKDTVGVTLAGSREEAINIIGKVPGIAQGDGPSLIFGTARHTTPLDAALINGISSHALDFDDCNDDLGGHPSVPILPALIALAEMEDATGADLLLAYVAGFETESRIGRGVNFHHYDKGWHATTTLGVFGGAAACSRFLGLSAEQTATALSLSASLASGIKANFGTMTKLLHVGQCARNALFATFMAREGFTACPSAFEHRQGFFNVFNGPGHYDAGRILSGWADPLNILNPGVAIKQYPCCGSTHSSIDAMLGLVGKHQLTPDTVARIDVMPHARRLAHTNRPDPQSSLDAKFSVQYCLARGLIHGQVVLEHFEGDAFRDPRTREVMQRIHAAPHPDMPMDTTEHFGAEVRVTKTDGQVLTGKVDRPRGRGPSVALSPQALASKFLNCATRVLADEQAAALNEMIDGFEKLTSVRAFTACCETNGMMQKTYAAK